jgi:hypothetical protein
METRMTPDLFLLLRPLVEAKLEDHAQTIDIALEHADTATGPITRKAYLDVAQRHVCQGEAMEDILREAAGRTGGIEETNAIYTAWSERTSRVNEAPFAVEVPGVQERQ